MTLLSISGLRVDFGATTILRDVTFTVTAGERWGIVGRNGAGKTTLFRVITNELSPTAGAVARTPGMRVALLDQHLDFGGAHTVWEGAAMAWRDLVALEQSLTAQGERLAELGDRVTSADIDRYARDQERFAHEGGYEMHARIEALLEGLGFDPQVAVTRPLASLSGGERGRLGLVAQLAAPADLILLDEPTNHLDIDTTRWLTNYLRDFAGTVLMISHDRAFLDDVVDHVLHVEAQTAIPYRGGYSSFVTQREERRLSQTRQVEKQRRFIAREEEYVRRNLAGQNSAQAKGRRTRLARLPRLSPPPGEEGAMSLRLEADDRGGDQVLVVDDLRVAIGDRVLVDDFTAVARRGDVIALVGPNGAGKSTFIATVLGERPPDGGEARVGGSVSVAWFRQDFAQVPRDTTLYDMIANQRTLWTRGQVQGHLGAFGFSGEQAKWNTSTLSGGELARAALALLTLQRANFLVFDEPTNHLDVESIEVLEDAIEEFVGTVIVVSHDRAFLREVATRVWAFEGTRIVDFDGPFVEWEVREASRLARAQAEREARNAAVRQAAREEARRTSGGRREDEEAWKSARRTAQALEREVETLEERIVQLETTLADPMLYGGGPEGARRAHELDTELQLAKRALNEALARWTEAAEQAEHLGRSARA